MRAPHQRHRAAHKAQDLYGQGRVADDIPALGEVAPRQFGMAVALCNGESHSVGDAHTAL